MISKSWQDAGCPPYGDVLDRLASRGGLLRSLGELLVAFDAVGHALQGVALEIEAVQHGADSLLAEQERRDAEDVAGEGGAQ